MSDKRAALTALGAVGILGTVALLARKPKKKVKRLGDEITFYAKVQSLVNYDLSTFVRVYINGIQAGEVAVLLQAARIQTVMVPGIVPREAETGLADIKCEVEHLGRVIATRVFPNMLTIQGEALLRRRPPCGKFGDLDGDGYITMKDVDILQSLFWQRVDLSNPLHVKADLNGDGRIDITDFSLMVGFIDGKINTFPVCKYVVPE